MKPSFLVPTQRLRYFKSMPGQLYSVLTRAWRRLQAAQRCREHTVLHTQVSSLADLLIPSKSHSLNWNITSYSLNVGTCSRFLLYILCLAMGINAAATTAPHLVIGVLGLIYTQILLLWSLVPSSISILSAQMSFALNPHFVASSL